ncbi:hypothetical protein V1508DRAFT_25031 [Lipomyces doorenjongii]|uniref:uncharacterized protein n=1 Tax=Lipomyces doorenjongii TaxID=383834 RepID=UPI0034CF2B10
MIKTGDTVLWQRFPIHIATTLPQLPHFAIYSDVPDIVAGTPIIDILANTKRTTKESSQFETYRQQQAQLAEHANVELTEAGITDGWQLDKYKNIPMVAHGYRAYPTAKWYIFMDADTYILWPNMMRWSSSINHEDMLYMGLVTYLGGKRFRLCTVDPAWLCLVRLLGRLLARNLAWQMNMKSTRKVIVAVIISCLMLFVIEVPFPCCPGRTTGFKNENWCKDVVTFHHLTAHDIEKLYEFERKYPRDYPILSKDVYHEFVCLIFVTTAKMVGITWQTSENIRITVRRIQKGPQVTAYNSYDNCSTGCQGWEECMQFRYRPGYCGLSNEIRLGLKHMDGDNSFSSFWRLDRIRQLRKSSGCDPIDAVQEEGAFF